MVTLGIKTHQLSLAPGFVVKCALLSGRLTSHRESQVGQKSISTLLPQMALQYNKLQAGQIRLLEILEDDGHTGRLHTVDLENAPSYTALSYFWGTPLAAEEARCFVTVNGVTVETQKNLHDALGQLGATVRKYRLMIWIDFLCIDQRNIDERGCQVTMMKKVFEEATVIYAWVGLPSDTEEVRLAVELM